MLKMSEASVARVTRDNLLILVIDVQPVFIESAFKMDSAAEESTLLRLEHLFMLASWKQLATIATFEVAGNISKGLLPARLEKVFPESGYKLDKRYFGCMHESEIEIVSLVSKLGVSQVVVAGCETDVCVMQSVLGLIELGYQVFLLEDCVFSSESNPGPALRRMYAAGAIPCTVKMLAYELGEHSGGVPWYPKSYIGDSIKESPLPENFQVPEVWPVWLNHCQQAVIDYLIEEKE